MGTEEERVRPQCPACPLLDWKLILEQALFLYIFQSEGQGKEGGREVLPYPRE